MASMFRRLRCASKARRATSSGTSSRQPQRNVTYSLTFRGSAQPPRFGRPGSRPLRLVTPEPTDAEAEPASSPMNGASTACQPNAVSALSESMNQAMPPTSVPDQVVFCSGPLPGTAAPTSKSAESSMHYASGTGEWD